MRKNNRRAERHEIRLSIRYRFATDTDSAWHHSTMLDLSEHGTAIEVFDAVPAQALQSDLILDLGIDDQTGLGTHLRATPRNIGPGPSGGIRIGAEFTKLNEWERSLLDRVLSSPLVTGPDGPVPLFLTGRRTRSSR